MLELYFIFYWLPKRMTQLARERKRSALAWSALAIGAWIGAELAIYVGFGTIYALGVEFWGWEEPQPTAHLVVYLFALGAAILSVMIVFRILRAKARHDVFPTPPPPPKFSD